MKIKIFGNKKIKIRAFSAKDLKTPKKFQEFINSLIEEEAPIILNKKVSIREEGKWLRNNLREIENQKSVYLIAEDKDTVVGIASIRLGRGRESHVGNFSISIKRNYRGMGLGSYLMKEVIKMTKRKLKPKILRLEVFPINKPAISLYKKFGFKRVAKIPKQIQYKGKLIDSIVMIRQI